MKPLILFEEIPAVGDLEDRIELPPEEMLGRPDPSDPKSAEYSCQCTNLCLKIYESRREELLKEHRGKTVIIIPAHQLDRKNHLLFIGPYGRRLVDYIRELYPNTELYQQHLGEEGICHSPLG